MKNIKNTHFMAALVALVSFVCLFCVPDAKAAAVDSSTIIWTGTADSDWSNAANWNLNRLPTAADYIGIGFGANTTLSISNTTATDVTYTTGGLSVIANTNDYTINIQGNSAGLATFHVAGGGFYSVNNNDSDLAIKVILNDYSKLIFTGGNSSATYPALSNASGRATLWGMALTMRGNSSADLTGASSNVLLASLDMGPSATINTGTYVLQMNRNSTISGAITSSRTSGEAMRVNGGNAGLLTILTPTGVVTLPGSSYCLVRNNTFQVDGVFNGGITLQANSNTALAGSGFVIGAVTSNTGAVVSPGSSTMAGTLSITGTLTMNSQTAINLSFFTTTELDHLIVNGALVLGTADAGVNLGVTRDEASFVVKDGRYHVITVNGDLDGIFNEKLVHNFGPLAEDSFWEIVPVSGGYEFWVNVRHSDFSNVTGLTANQYVIANALDRIQSSLPDALIMSIDSQKSITAYGKVLNQLGPQAYQAWYSAAVVQSSALGSSIENRLAIPDEKLREYKKFDVYAQASRYTSTQDATVNNEYYEINPEQILVGADYAFSPSFLAGLVYAYDKTDYTLDDSGSSGDSKGHTYGVFARFRTGKLQTSVLGYYGTDSYTANRNVSFTRLGSFAHADTDGKRSGARALVSYTIEPGWFDFIPTLGVQYMRWEVDGFAESGGANEAALTVGKQKKDSVIATAGFQIARNFEILKGKAVIRPFLNAYWMFRGSRGDRDIEASVMGEAVSVRTSSSDRNGWHIEGGVSLDYYSGLSLFASYANDSKFTVDQTVAIRAGVGYRF